MVCQLNVFSRTSALIASNINRNKRVHKNTINIRDVWFIRLLIFRFPINKACIHMKLVGRRFFLFRDSHWTDSLLGHNAHIRAWRKNQLVWLGSKNARTWLILYWIHVTLLGARSAPKWSGFAGKRFTEESVAFLHLLHQKHKWRNFAPPKYNFFCQFPSKQSDRVSEWCCGQSDMHEHVLHHLFLAIYETSAQFWVEWTRKMENSVQKIVSWIIKEIVVNDRLITKAHKLYIQIAHTQMELDRLTRVEASVVDWPPLFVRSACVCECMRQ